jgi:hypothetical protein
MAIVGSDTFTESSNTDLENHTPDVGSGWSVPGAGNFAIVGSNDDVSHTVGTTFDIARKEDDIGDDAMDVSASCKTHSATGSRHSGVAARVSGSDLDNGFLAVLRTANSSEDGNISLYLFKKVSGTVTELGSYTAGINSNELHTIKLSIRSGSQKVYLDDVERISATEPDSTLQGNTYAGICMGGSASSHTRITTFQSESVEADTEQKNASDTLELELTEGTTVLNSTLSRSDDLTVELTEGTPTIAVDLSRSDDVTVQLAESVTTRGILNRSDILSIVMEEGSPVLNVALSRTDALSIELSELITILSRLSRTDALSLALTDTSALIARLNRTDTLPLVLTEGTPTLLSRLSRTDDLTLTLTDLSALTALFSVADTLGITLSDLADIVESGIISKSASDTLSLALTGQVTINTRLQRADALALQLLEERQIHVTVQSLSDTLGISLSEALSVLQAISVSDTISLVLSGDSDLVQTNVDEPQGDIRFGGGSVIRGHLRLSQILRGRLSGGVVRP